MPKTTQVLVYLLLTVLALDIILAFSVFYEPGRGLVFNWLSQDKLDAAAAGSAQTQLPAASEPLYLPLYGEKLAEMRESKLDFLEVNLEDMLLRFYKQGQLWHESVVLAKGDPQEWGGSAVGLYKIERGYPQAFSAIAEVYMPFSLFYYGKYYLHGEPFYPGGEKLVSDVSGGCIRQADADAEFTYENVDINMPVLVIDKNRAADDYASVVATPFPELTAASYLVADLDSGFVFAQQDIASVRPIASLTKLMTATVLTENIDLRKKVVATASELKAYGQTELLTAGQSYGLVELLYPLLIESSNDAAEVLGGFMGRVTTINKLNQKARAILMSDTRFEDLSGFDPGNVSTAKDLFYLARYILNNRPLLWQITKSQYVRSFNPVRFDLEKLWNKNVFAEDSAFVGGKTGFITTSGYNGLFVFKLKTRAGQSRNIAVILLNSVSMASQKTDTQKLNRWLLANYFDPPPESPISRN